MASVDIKSNIQFILWKNKNSLKNYLYKTLMLQININNNKKMLKKNNAN